MSKIHILVCYGCKLYDLGTDLEGKTQVGFKGEDFGQKRREWGNFPVAKTT